MATKEQNGTHALVWTGRVFSADDLRRHWHGQNELVLPTKSIVTPLASEELRDKGIRVTRQEPQISLKLAACTWTITQEMKDPVVAAAVAALAKEGLNLSDSPVPTGTGWLANVMRFLQSRNDQGLVIFCGDPAWVCCLANKVADVRAASVVTAATAVKAMKTLGANVLGIEMPGRTFFEVRQILKIACSTRPVCPPETERALKEIADHANR